MSKKAKVAPLAPGAQPKSSWGKVYSHLASPKIEPPKDTMLGAVYFGLRKIKHGSVADVQKAAEEHFDLKKLTGQNRYVQTQVMLRRLVEEKAAKVEHPDKTENGNGAAKKAAPSLKVSRKKATKAKAKSKKAPKPVDVDESDDIEEDDDTEVGDEE